MNEKPVKIDITFQEALRRIAKTPKEAVPKVDEKKKEQAAPSSNDGAATQLLKKARADADETASAAGRAHDQLKSS